MANGEPAGSAGGEALEAEQEYDIAQPQAGAMIHSLRAFGYDLATALADLIHNSIAAAAKNIWLKFYWDGAKSRVAIIDDGKGMSEAELKSPACSDNPNLTGVWIAEITRASSLLRVGSSP